MANQGNHVKGVLVWIRVRQRQHFIFDSLYLRFKVSISSIEAISQSAASN